MDRIIAKSFPITIDLKNVADLENNYQCKSGDNIQLVIEVLEDSIKKDLSGCKANLLTEVELLDGSSFIIETDFDSGKVKIDEQSSKITILLKSSATANIGKLKNELHIYDTDETIIGCSIIIDVKESINGNVLSRIDNDIISLPLLSSLLVDIDEEFKSVNEKIKNIQSGMSQSNPNNGIYDERLRNIESEIGDTTLLKTTETTLVGAINEINSSSVAIEDNLTSTSKTSSLSANQGKVLNDKIGNLNALTTTDKSSVINAINEINAKPVVGSSIIVEDVLTSTNTSNALSANQGKVLKDEIGELIHLATTDKTNLVSAINELKPSVIKIPHLYDLKFTFGEDATDPYRKTVTVAQHDSLKGGENYCKWTYGFTGKIGDTLDDYQGLSFNDFGYTPSTEEVSIKSAGCFVNLLIYNVASKEILDIYKLDLVNKKEVPYELEYLNGAYMGYQLGNADNLNTTSKQIVGAINEVNAKVGSSGSSSSSSYDGNLKSTISVDSDGNALEITIKEFAKAPNNEAVYNPDGGATIKNVFGSYAYLTLGTDDSTNLFDDLKTYSCISLAYKCIDKTVIPSMIRCKAYQSDKTTPVFYCDFLKVGSRAGTTEESLDSDTTVVTFLNANSYDLSKLASQIGLIDFEINFTWNNITAGETKVISEIQMFTSQLRHPYWFQANEKYYGADLGIQALALKLIDVETRLSQTGGGSGSSVVVEDVLTSTSATNALSANKGKELKDEMGDLTHLSTTVKTDLVSSINSVDRVSKLAYQNLGGLKIEKITQAEYDVLTTKDAHTLYVIV